MTQLERELKLELKLQREMFAKELQSVTNGYEKQMSEALAVIERQNKTLEQYESISTNWQINLNKEQLHTLIEQIKTTQKGTKILSDRLDTLTEDLGEKLDSLSRKL